MPAGKTTFEKVSQSSINAALAGFITTTGALVLNSGIGTVQTQTATQSSTGGNARGAYSVDFQSIRGTAAQVASGTQSVLAGGRANMVSGLCSVVSGGFTNAAGGQYTVVAGGAYNTASATYSGISAGYYSSATGDYSFVGGGSGNQAAGRSATIAGGESNVVNNNFGAIAGGGNNRTYGGYAFIGGGYDNVAEGDNSFLGGGDSNASSGNWSSLGGGQSNKAEGGYSTVAGGYHNYAQAWYSWVPGGYGADPTHWCEGAYASTEINGRQGSIQRGMVTLARVSLDDTQQEMLINYQGPGEPSYPYRWTLTDMETYGITLDVVGVRLDGSAYGFAQYKCLILNRNQVVTMVPAAPTPVSAYGSNSGVLPTEFVITLQADQASAALKVLVQDTGAGFTYSDPAVLGSFVSLGDADRSQRGTRHAHGQDHRGVQQLHAG